MSLTTEVIKGNEATAGLEDAQVAAIVEMSVNDEDTVIGTKTGEIYGGIDKDVEGALGVKKPEGKKTYDWLKDDILPMVGKSKEFETQVQTLTTEKTVLEEKLAKGANVDPEIKRQLDEKTETIATMTTQYEADKTALQGKIDGMVKTTNDSKINFESKTAESKLTFLDGIPESSRPILINSVKGQILNEFNTEFIDDGNGGEVLVFKDKATGVVKNNPDNNLKPFTLEDMYRVRLKDNLKGAEDKKKGAGSGAGGAGGGGSETLILTGVTTQVEADAKIQEYIMKSGITRESPEFQPKFQEIRKENKVEQLKMK